MSEYLKEALKRFKMPKDELHDIDAAAWQLALVWEGYTRKTDFSKRKGIEFKSPDERMEYIKHFVEIILKSVKEIRESREK